MFIMQNYNNREIFFSILVSICTANMRSIITKSFHWFAALRQQLKPCIELFWPQNRCSASGLSCSCTAAVTSSEFTVCEEDCDWFTSGTQTHYKYLMSLVFLLIWVRLLLTSCHSAPPSPRCVWTSQTGGPQSWPCRMSALSTCWSITLPAPTYSHFWKSHLTSLTSKANFSTFTFVTEEVSAVRTQRL